MCSWIDWWVLNERVGGQLDRSALVGLKGLGLKCVLHVYVCGYLGGWLSG